MIPLIFPFSSSRSFALQSVVVLFVIVVVKFEVCSKTFTRREKDSVEFVAISIDCAIRVFDRMEWKVRSGLAALLDPLSGFSKPGVSGIYLLRSMRDALGCFSENLKAARLA